MIEVLQEITDWGGDNIPNHIYHVDRTGALVGYVPVSTGIYKQFKKPVRRFSKSRRKFKIIAHLTEDTDSEVKTVIGSKGDVYTIIDGQCSCPGFKYRGKCKHTTPD